MFAKGIIGIRLNLIRASDGVIDDLLDKNTALMRTIRKNDMQLELHIESQRLMKILEKVVPLVNKIAIDHFALPIEGQAGRITKEPEAYSDLKRYADLDKIWIKNSGSYTVLTDASFDEAVKNCAHLAKVLADFMLSNHILRGSDWSFTMNSQKVNGNTAMEKYKSIFSTYGIWSDNGKLYNSDLAFTQLIDK